MHGPSSQARQSAMQVIVRMTGMPTPCPATIFACTQHASLITSHVVHKARHLVASQRQLTANNSAPCSVRMMAAPRNAASSMHNSLCAGADTMLNNVGHLLLWREFASQVRGRGPKWAVTWSGNRGSGFRTTGSQNWLRCVSLGKLLLLLLCWCPLRAACI